MIEAFLQGVGIAAGVVTGTGAFIVGFYLAGPYVVAFGDWLFNSRPK